MSVFDYLHEVSVRIENTDFTPYFAFLESLPIAETGHKRHILPKKEFPEFAKDLNNLIRLSPADHFRAHYWLAVCAPQCGSFQRTFFLMANRKFATQTNKDELAKCAEVYERGKNAAIELARVNAGIQGRKNVETGHLVKVRTRVGSAKGGHTQGEKNTESGLIQSLGRIWGRRAAQSGQLRELGRIQGQGRKNVESGLLRSIATAGGRASTANHLRWHVKRGMVNSACRFCGSI